MAGVDLSGRVALVTGGGRGIGRAIAEALAGAGAAVAVVGRTPGPLAETVAAISGQGGVASAHAGDVSSETDVETVVGGVLERYGRLDVLVNNAALEGPTAPLHEVAPREWDEVLGVNVRGAYLMTRAVAPHLLERGSGHVLFLSALGGGLRAYPLRAPYAVSKAAVLALMHTAAAELGPKGVRVNAITPGPVKGERLERVFAKNPALEERLESRMLNRRIPNGDEVAAVALFLLSPAADSIVGQSINMTGGLETLF